MPQCQHKLQHLWTGERKGRHSLAWGQGLVSPSRSIILTALSDVGSSGIALVGNKQRQQSHCLPCPGHSDCPAVCPHSFWLPHKPNCTASTRVASYSVRQQPLHLGLALNCPSLKYHWQSRTEMSRQNPLLHTESFFQILVASTTLLETLKEINNIRSLLVQKKETPFPWRTQHQK